MKRACRADATQPSIDRQVASLAASQFGVFTRDQATRLGATKGVIQHRLATGRWEYLSARDVFKLAGIPPSWRQSLLAACLAWGDGAVVSHRAAAALWRLAGFVSSLIELTVPRERRRKGPGIVHRNRLLPTDTTHMEAIPVTTPARTLIDVASIASAEVVEEAFDDALRRGIVSITRVRRTLEAVGGRGGRPGVALMPRLLDVRSSSTVPQSVLETRLLRVVRAAGLPQPVLQHEIWARGRLVAIVDFAYPTERLAIEADGYQWHSGRLRWHHDRLRQNELTLLGWRVIHVTWADLCNRPAAVVDSLEHALAGSV